MTTRLMARHTVCVHGHYTAITIEAPFWREFRAIMRELRVNDPKITIRYLIEEIDNGRRQRHTLSSSVRIFVLEHVKRKLAQAAIAGMSPVASRPYVAIEPAAAPRLVPEEPRRVPVIHEHVEAG